MWRPWPQRPEVESEKAKWILDWIDVGAYGFWVCFAAAVAILAIAKGVPSDVVSLLGRLR
jgi:heme exporter protein D